MELVVCPICEKRMTVAQVNFHLDRGCSAGSMEGDVKKDEIGVANGLTVRREDTQNTRRETMGKKEDVVSKNPLFQKRPTTTTTPSLGAKRTASLAFNNRSYNGGSNKEEPIMIEDDETGEGGGKKVKIAKRERNKPLAEMLRPKSMEEYIGQKDLVGEGGLLRSFIENDLCPSMILWGPSGVCE